MYNECIYVCLLTVYWEVFLPFVFWNKLLKLSYQPILFSRSIRQVFTILKSFFHIVLCLYTQKADHVRTTHIQWLTAATVRLHCCCCCVLLLSLKMSLRYKTCEQKEIRCVVYMIWLFTGKMDACSKHLKLTAPASLPVYQHLTKQSWFNFSWFLYWLYVD